MKRDKRMREQKEREERVAGWERDVETRIVGAVDTYFNAFPLMIHMTHT